MLQVHCSQHINILGYSCYQSNKGFFQQALISDIGLSSTMATFSLNLKSLATSLASLEQSSQMDK